MSFFKIINLDCGSISAIIIFVNLRLKLVNFLIDKSQM
jgi:hypothetical protein